MDFFLPFPEGKKLWQENKSWQGCSFSLWWKVRTNKSISCVPGNRKWNVFCPFLKEKSYGKKTKVDMDVLKSPWWPVSLTKLIFRDDQLKNINPFPVCQETGNGIISALSWRKKNYDKKTKVDKDVLLVPVDQSNQINIPWWPFRTNKPISCGLGNRKWNYFCSFLKEKSYGRKTKVDKHVFIISDDPLENLNPFPVCHKTGNGIISTLTLRILWQEK